MENEEMDSSEQEISVSDLWENIGFHRPLGGFFYKLPLEVLSLGLGFIFAGFLWGILYPFPESMGYRSAIIGIFSLFFQAMDLGTANMMKRFIGESNIKDPKKMVKYIQYFIWYQMWTGLIQTTVIAIYALYYVPESQLTYAIWIMICHSLVQYPGMLRIFYNTLNTLQQYNKTAVLTFIADDIFQRIIEIGFVLVGKYYGIAHPEIGELMGIAIGATVGYYADDFLATIVSAKYFAKVLKGYGFTLRDCFRSDFGKGIFKECFTWGLKSGIPGLLMGFVSYLTMIFWLNNVYQYTTFIALAGIAKVFSNPINYSIDLGGAISESFMNDKKKLASYYVAQAWRYTGLIHGFMFSILILFSFILDDLYICFNLKYYLLSAPFMFPQILRNLQNPFHRISNNILSGTGRINFQMIMQILEAGVTLIFWILIILVFKIPQNAQFITIIWLMSCGDIFIVIGKMLVNYYYIHKHVLKLKIPFYQTFIGPWVSTFIVLGLGYIYYRFIFNPMHLSLNFIIAFIPMVIICFALFPVFLYFPLTCILGSWDDQTMKILKKAYKISGAGKVISYPLYKILTYISKKTPLYNKFTIDDQEAMKELKELMTLKNKTRKEQYKIDIA
ncbi:MAG: hypothetical protein GF364_07335 [Candidatus Lokiarchaeota archaeon]|nr:hypothetical protein [Candidatus Lokiarchaeota archaeon]